MKLNMRYIAITLLFVVSLFATSVASTNTEPVAAAAPFVSSRCGNTGNKVLLVFDDYPISSKKWKALIRTAHRNNIGIGVAPTGSYVKSGLADVGFAHQYGMLVVDHAYAHKYLTELPYKKVVWQITRPYNGSNYVRPPYGAYNKKVLKAFKNTGKYNCMWNLDPRDWDGRTPEKAARYIIRHAQKGSTAVVHLNHLGTKPNLLITIKEGLAKRGIKMCKPWDKKTPVIMPASYCD